MTGKCCSVNKLWASKFFFSLATPLTKIMNSNKESHLFIDFRTISVLFPYYLSHYFKNSLSAENCFCFNFNRLFCRLFDSAARGGRAARPTLAMPPLNKYVVDRLNSSFVDSSWNVMAHGDAREGNWSGNCWMEWVASTLHTTSEHGVSSIRVQLKPDGTRWRTGGEVKGKLANGVGSQYSSHYLGTCCIRHYYRWCAHLCCQQSTELTPSPI
jgi:hypothetical protein